MTSHDKALIEQMTKTIQAKRTDVITEPAVLQAFKEFADAEANDAYAKYGRTILRVDGDVARKVYFWMFKLDPGPSPEPIDDWAFEHDPNNDPTSA